MKQNNERNVFRPGRDAQDNPRLGGTSQQSAATQASQPNQMTTLGKPKGTSGPKRRNRPQRKPTFRVFQWNCRNIKSRIYQLRNYANRLKPQVLAIQESGLTNASATPSLNGYLVHRVDRKLGSDDKAGGGLLLYVKSRDRHIMTYC